MANDGMVHNEIEGKYLVLISGIMAAGESTMGQALGERRAKRVRLRVDVDGIVGTRLHTGLAADADARGELDDVVVSVVRGRDRTAG